MKLFKAIAAAVVIGGFLLIPNPAKAQYLDLSSLNFDQCMEKFESYYYCENSITLFVFYQFLNQQTNVILYVIIQEIPDKDISDRKGV